MTNIVVGVVHNCSAEWLLDAINSAINLDYEYAALEHCKQCDDYHDGARSDNCIGCDGCADGFDCTPDDTLLIGFKQVLDSSQAWYEVGEILYGIDHEADYSAIVGSMYTQVVHSTHAQRCHKCSPCYPGQGDLDTPGDYYLAYTLPPDVWGDSAPVLYRLAQDANHD